MKKIKLPEGAKTEQEKIEEMFEENEHNEVEEEVEVEEKKEVKAEKAQKTQKETIAVKTSNVFEVIRANVHGFFVIATIVAVVIAVLFFKNANLGRVFIQIPVIELSYFRIAVLAAFLGVVGSSITSKK